MGLSRAIGWIGLGALAVSVATGPSAGASDSIAWLTETGKAMAVAADQGQPVMVDVWAVWCEPCKLMEATTYRDPRVLRDIKGFVALKVDADANEVFIERYEIDAFPTTIFLDSEGREITRLLSHVETEVLLETMGLVREGYGDYVERVEHADDPASMRQVADYLLQAGNGRRATEFLRRALKSSQQAGDGAGEALELRLAEALLADDRAGAAVKLLGRLSSSASSEAVRGEALAVLVRAERERGKDAKADEALARLHEEFPDLVSSVE